MSERVDGIAEILQTHRIGKSDQDCDEGCCWQHYCTCGALLDPVEAPAGGYGLEEHQAALIADTLHLDQLRDVADCALAEDDGPCQECGTHPHLAKSVLAILDGQSIMP